MCAHLVGDHVNALADLETSIAAMEKTVEEMEEAEANVTPLDRDGNTIIHARGAMLFVLLFISGSRWNA